VVCGVSKYKTASTKSRTDFHRRRVPHGSGISREFVATVMSGTGVDRGAEIEGPSAHKRCRVSQTESGESSPWQSGRSAIGDSR
jgi:hypothetical protein